MSPVLICLQQQVQQQVQQPFRLLASSETALKIIFIYVWGCEKRKPKHIHMDMREIRFEKTDFRNSR